MKQNNPVPGIALSLRASLFAALFPVKVSSQRTNARAIARHVRVQRTAGAITRNLLPTPEISPEITRHVTSPKKHFASQCQRLTATHGSSNARASVLVLHWPSRNR